MRLNALIVAASLLMGGCSTLTDLGVVRKEALRNDDGHLVGYKQIVRSERTGEVFAQVQMFTPVRGADGSLVGYEEQVRDGAVIRDLSGRPIGNRFADLRSRKTLTIVFRPAETQVAQVSRPKLQELMASLSASDLRRIQ
jgi:hypothetical protein